MAEVCPARSRPNGGSSCTREAGHEPPHGLTLDGMVVAPWYGGFWPDEVGTPCPVHCDSCGGPMFSKRHDAERASLYCGACDQVHFFGPDGHYQVKSTLWPSHPDPYWELRAWLPGKVQEAEWAIAARLAVGVLTSDGAHAERLDLTRAYQSRAAELIDQLWWWHRWPVMVQRLLRWGAPWNRRP